MWAGYRNQIQRWRMIGFSMSGPLEIPVVFLFRDDFITAEGAPMVSPRTAEPGPGIGTIIDTGNNYSIVGGQLVSAATAGIGDPRYLSQAFPRIAGLCGYGIIRWSSRGIIGWEDGTGNPLAQSLAVISGANFFAYDSGIASGSLGIRDPVIEYQTAVILRSAGAFFLIKEGIFTEWTLLYVHNTENSANLNFGVANRVTTPLFDNLRVSQLPAPWDTDNGIATDVLPGARSAGDTFVHEADCLIEYEATTLPAAGRIDFRFRIQDATNYWQIRHSSAGSFELREVVAGVPTSRANGAIAAPSRIVLIAEGNVIRGYDDNNLDFTYSAANNFQTETDGELISEGTGGAVSDIISWPRVISGDALTALNRVANA